MKKIFAVLLALLMLLMVCLPVSAAGLNIPTIEYEGKTYYNLGGKDDYFKAARYGIDNGLTAVPVHIDYKKFPDYESNNIWYCNVSNFDYTQEGLYFTYQQYATSTVCMTGYHHDFENDLVYGDIEISYIDSKEELKKADAMLDAVLSKVSTYSKVDKIRYIASYICEKVDAGFQKMPGGEYDTINGVHDLMTGVRTNVVCSSFAFLFQRFMERAGYKSYIATGCNHAWNVVELDGKWYGVDCTYGDNGKAMDSNYFLMGMDKLKGYITDTENVFAELQKEKGCQFAAAAYGAKPTTTTTMNLPLKTTIQKPIATTSKKPSVGISSSTNTTTTTEQQSTKLDAETTTQSLTEDTTTAAPTNATTAQPTVTVDISQQVTVEAQVFHDAVQNGETLVLQAQDYQWSFAADKLTNVDNAAALDTTIHLGDQVDSKDVEVLKEINNEQAFFPFSFEHHGDLPGEVEISIRVNDETFANKTVDIYTINAAGKAVKEGSGTVTAEGELVFRTNHCSLWFIKEAPANATSLSFVWIIVAAAVIVTAAIVTAVLFLKRKKNV